MSDYSCPRASLPVNFNQKEIGAMPDRFGGDRLQSKTGQDIHNTNIIKIKKKIIYNLTIVYMKILLFDNTNR
jgi:hypothetical protein